MNDREQMLAWQQAQQAERNIESQLDHYQALGMGLAAFCLSMAVALTSDEAQTFTREEVLRLVESAVRGR